MNAALRAAHAYGIRVAIEDLGDWGKAELRAEYDPSEPVIRVNARIADTLGAIARERFIAQAIGHELYHHREALGELPRLRDACAREAAADAYATHLLEDA